MELKAVTTAPLLLQQGYLKVIEDGSGRMTCGPEVRVLRPVADIMSDKDEPSGPIQRITFVDDENLVEVLLQDGDTVVEDGDWPAFCIIDPAEEKN